MVELRPSEIRFIQAGISSYFKDRNSVNEAAEDLCSGKLQPSSFPSIRIVRLDGEYWSFDNRRLYVFRVAEYRGVIDHIRVRIADPDQLIPERKDTENEGRKVFVRGDETLDHCKPDWLCPTPSYRPVSTRRILGEISPNQVPARITSSASSKTVINIGGENRTPDPQRVERRDSTEHVELQMPGDDEDDFEQWGHGSSNSWCSCTIL